MTHRADGKPERSLPRTPSFPSWWPTPRRRRDCPCEPAGRSYTVPPSPHLVAARTGSRPEAGRHADPPRDALRHRPRRPPVRPLSPVLPAAAQSGAGAAVHHRAAGPQRVGDLPGAGRREPSAPRGRLRPALSSLLLDPRAADVAAERTRTLRTLSP